MEKKTKKIIVNVITSSRIIAALSMPLLVSLLSTPAFIWAIAIILLTDFIDGALARHWNVSTIFGSLLDMGSDKVFAIAILVVLSTMFPVMLIPLSIEMFISVFNLNNGIKGKVSKSSQIGRIKTWILGLSIFSLLVVGLSPELLKGIEATKDFNFEETVNFLKNSVGVNLDNILNTSKEALKSVLEYILKHKDIIRNVSVSSAIISDTVVAADYGIKSLKEEKKDNIKIKDILKDKEKLQYIKNVILDEKYYKATKDMTMYDKLLPDEEKLEEIKKLVLENN